MGVKEYNYKPIPRYFSIFITIEEPRQEIKDLWEFWYQ
jgi:hypothetical protein